MKKQEENITSLRQRIKMLEESSKKKDLMISKYEEKLTHLNRQDQSMWELLGQQRDLVKSLLVKLTLEKKTKFIQGSRKLQYHRTAPSVSVRHESCFHHNYEFLCSFSA